MSTRGWRWLGLAAALSGCAAHERIPAPTSAATAPELPQRFASPYAYEQFIRAELMRARGDLAGAAAAYRAAQTSDGEDAYLLARLAGVLDELGPAHEADETLDDALQLDPRSEEAWITRGAIAERRGDLSTAFESYERAEAAAPISPRGPLALSALLRAGGHLERADAVIARLNARRLPGGPVTPPQPTTKAAELQALLAQARWAEAEALLTLVDPAAIGGITALAEVYLAARRPERALELAHLACERDPADARAQLVAARAALALGRYVEAAETFANALRLDPGLTDARAGMAVALRASALPELAAEVDAHGDSAQ